MMKKINRAPQDDLTDLIKQADRAVARNTSSNTAGRKKGIGSLFPYVAMAIMVSIIIFALLKITEPYRAPSSATVANDLENVLEAARLVIEQHKTLSGHYPNRIPNASLAHLVRYEPDSSGYSLTASVMGLRVSLKWDGFNYTKSVEDES